MRRIRTVLILIFALAVLSAVLSSCSSSSGGSDFSPPAGGVGRSDVAVTDTEKREPDLPDNGKTIMIDPGHGFRDAGSGAEDHELGPDTNEADVNLAVAKLLKEELLHLGYKVIMTHEGEITPEIQKYVSKESYQTYYFDPDERVELINSKKPDYSISLHCNVFGDPDVRGTKAYVFDNTLYSDNESENVKKARKIIERLHAVFPDAKEPTLDSQSYALVRDTTCDSVLIEMGFVTNPEDAANLIDPEWQKTFARGVAEGVDSYFNPNGTAPAETGEETGSSTAKAN